ncbi:MAG: arginine--tRNA ligase [Candidatus Buchananbacteria bacterium]
MDYTIIKVKQQIKEAVQKALGQEIDQKHIEIGVPPEKDMGDLAIPCFYFAKLLRLSPNRIAEELKNKIRPVGFIESANNAGPYLNIILNKKVLAQKVLNEISKKGEKFGSLKSDKEKIMIEYSNPNTHKEFHIGHSRNAILGASLVNVYKFAGKKVIPVNYIGDIGSHVAKCLWALEKFHKDEPLPENKGKYLGGIYGEAVRRIDENTELKKETDEVQQKLESGDKYWMALWKKTKAWSMDELKEIYKLLNAKFDKIFFESEVEKPGKKIVAELMERGIAEKSQGAVVINLEKYNLRTLLLLKSDGSSLYSTKELALAQLKFDKYKIDKSIVIVDNRQGFYFQQFFKTLEIMGFDKKMEHIPYEFVTLKDGAMSSRSGNIVPFEDFFEKVVELAKAETQKRHQDWNGEKISDVSQKIALSAIKFNMIKTNNSNIIVFDVEEALSFDGFTGPYLQYTISRINSILKKESPKGEIDFAKLENLLEKELILKASNFPEIIAQCQKENQPSILAKYLFELAKLFSNYYQNIPILKSEQETKKARLFLISNIRQVLINGISLLGIDVLEEM